MDRGAEGIKHLHFLKDIFAAGGPDDEKLAALVTERKMCYRAQKRTNEETGGSLNDMSGIYLFVYVNEQAKHTKNQDFPNKTK